MSRKYRQRGYQESDRDEKERSQSPQRKELSFEERIQRRSMRKATDREAKEVVRCQVCGRNVEDFGTIASTTNCPHCNAPLHCCRVCKHFDSSARWQCRAEITEAVSDKSKANQCGHYEPRLVLDFTGRRGSKHRSNDPKSAFDNLFKR
jgi:hypothetical protein